jgi:hypothetical protein
VALLHKQQAIYFHLKLAHSLALASRLRLVLAVKVLHVHWALLVVACVHWFPVGLSVPQSA